MPTTLKTRSARQGAPRHSSGAGPAGKMARLLASTCCLMSMSLPLPLLAAPSAADLGKDLTAVGAERAGNKAGTIPAWTGESTVTGSFQAGNTLRKDHWRYTSDKPLYSIDASNADQHADKLSPGMLAVLKQIQGFRMDVYPTRRTCNAPDFVVENTKKNIGFAKIGANGWSLAEAYVPGIPFPIPQSGVEAMWNQKLRYRGVGGGSTSGYTFVSPSKGRTDWIAPAAGQINFFPWALPGSRKLSEIGDINMHTYYQYKSPAALAGQAGMVTDYFDKPGTDAYYYFPGQRRVRRMPAYAYDAPQIGFENQYAMDETSVFMGALDRFDWKLVGKRELVVPYNSFGAFDFKSDWKNIVLLNGIVPTHRRYELHRVWVVEATAKPGVRHMAPKRTFYLDEDSWNVILAEDYDAQGKLVKAREGYLIPIFEVGNACDAVSFSQYNLLEGRVLADFTSIGSGTDTVYFAQPKGPEMKSDFYTSENLRALSER
jgi:hypothetical protein